MYNRPTLIRLCRPRPTHSNWVIDNFIIIIIMTTWRKDLWVFCAEVGQGRTTPCWVQLGMIQAVHGKELQRSEHFSSDTSASNIQETTTLVNKQLITEDVKKQCWATLTMDCGNTELSWIKQWYLTSCKNQIDYCCLLYTSPSPRD